MTGRRFVELWALGFLVGCSAGEAQVAGNDLPVARSVAFATFDTVWTRIARTHPDTTFNGVDWDATARLLRPRVDGVETMGGLRALLGEFLGHLDQSHFRIVPLRGSPLEIEPEGSASDRIEASVIETVAGGIGIEWTVVDNRVVVTRVFADGPAERAGVRSGWVVDEIGGWDVAGSADALSDAGSTLDRRVAELSLLDRVNEALRGPVGEAIDIRFRSGDEEAVSLRLDRNRDPGEWVRIGMLPPARIRFEAESVPTDSGCVGRIRFDTWLPMVDSLFTAALDELDACDGLVLDLRGNRGGLAAMVRGIAGHFFAEPISLGRTRSRTGSVEYRVTPRRADRAFDAPLALLVDAYSMSTSELFAYSMQSVGRARVFGTATSGFALSAAVAPLPSGDLLLHGVGEYFGPDGRLLEGRGVTPDIPVAIDRADLLRQEDPVLAEAFFWIAGQIGDTH